ncbi:MAG: hypothetical protein U1G07_05765 [Verrucomicrobiota bacterium]
MLTEDQGQPTTTNGASGPTDGSAAKSLGSAAKAPVQYGAQFEVPL